MQLAKRLDTIHEYYFSQKLRQIEEMNRSGDAVINLGIGSPDLPPHPDVISVLHQESTKPQVHAYQGYKGAKALRDAVAQWYQTWYGVALDADTEVLPLIGSKEGIMHICMTFLNEGDEVLIPNPGYPTYRSAVTLAGGTCREYVLSAANQYLPDLEALQQTGLNRVKLMFINYPHMPTGARPTKEIFEQVVRFARKNNILVVHDNPYSFILNDSPSSLLSVEGAKEVVIELNSLSKSHNMAGWRVGMLCGSKENVDAVLRFKSNMDSGMFLPVQLAAAKALTLGKDWHEALNHAYRRRREKAQELVGQVLGCSYDPNQVGLFLWAEVNSRYKDGFEMSEAILKECRVFITPGGIFGSAGQGYIRLSLCSTEEKIEEAINRVKR